MPLGKNVTDNIHELMEDNKLSGQERGNNGKIRSHKQILAIALSSARKAGNHKVKPYDSD